MPASPEPRSKWKKRKQITKRHKQEPDDDDDEDDDDDDIDPEDDAGADDQSVPDPAPISREIEVLSDAGVRISDFPVVVKRVVNRAHSSVLGVAALERAVEVGEGGKERSVVLENVSYGQLQAVSAVPAGGEGYVVAPPVIMEGRGVVKKFGNTRVLVVPMHSDWFSPTTVHRLERQVVPQFFSGKSPDHTSEKYMECRNCIVGKYMENPDKRLTITDCHGLSLGIDSEDLARIVRFLDHWGIINYCAPPPNCATWTDSSYLKEDMNGEIVVPSIALKSIDSLIQFDKPKYRLKPDDISCHSDDETSDDLDRRIRERLSENRCNSCSVHLPIIYYQSQKEVDVLLCADCFHDGKYIAGHSSIDFIRMDSTKDYGDVDGESWTDQETLLMLEAMEIYHDNWNDIAEHVGTKSKAQCILHFIRMPMEDGLLENIEVPNMPVSYNGSNNDDPGRYSSSNGNTTGSSGLHELDSESRLPFANSANPVMALVSFLASAVGPRVAAACAHASLAALSEDSSAAASGIIQMEGSSPGYRIGGSHGEITNVGQQKEENLTAQGSETMPLSAEKVKAAAKAGLSAAAEKAKQFADHEEREIQRLSANIINHQLKRLELKLKQFAEVETMLMKECEQVERARQRFATERTRIISTRFASPGSTAPVGLPGLPPSMINNNTPPNNNRQQQVISASPSQSTTIPGFGSNQPTHPHMPFVPSRQQQMFSMGSRLPLSAIHPSSSGPNAMFNPPGNPQQGLGHPMMRPVSGTNSGLG